MRHEMGHDITSVAVGDLPGARPSPTLSPVFFSKYLGPFGGDRWRIRESPTPRAQGWTARARRLSPRRPSRCPTRANENCVSPESGRRNVSLMIDLCYDLAQPVSTADRETRHRIVQRGLLRLVALAPTTAHRISHNPGVPPYDFMVAASPTVKAKGSIT
jgi:hypothetical protein